MDSVRTATITVIAPRDAGIPGRMDLAVLGLTEDGEWCAIALDMRIRAYGETFDQAFEELRDAVKAQITFALEHGGDAGISFPAEEKYIRMYAQARHREVETLLGLWLHARDSAPKLPSPAAVEKRPTLRFRMPTLAARPASFVAA